MPHTFRSYWNGLNAVHEFMWKFPFLVFIIINKIHYETECQSKEGKNTHNKPQVWKWFRKTNIIFININYGNSSLIQFRMWFDNLIKPKIISTTKLRSHLLTQTVSCLFFVHSVGEKSFLPPNKLLAKTILSRKASIRKRMFLRGWKNRSNIRTSGVKAASKGLRRLCSPLCPSNDLINLVAS